MGCVLRVWGKICDVDAFLRESSLQPITVWHPGESQSPASNPTSRLQGNSGMHISISRCEFSDLAGQIKDAVSFLHNNHVQLLRLRNFPGIEGAVMDFPVEDRDVACQTDVFPFELLASMGDLRMALAISRYSHGDNEMPDL
jgi:hypothetical protein